MTLPHLNLLGLEGEDNVTNFKGIVTSVAFDLYGCIQVIIQPVADKEGVIPEALWFDVGRIEVQGTNSVIPQPDFMASGSPKWEKGPAMKPTQKHQRIL